MLSRKRKVARPGNGSAHTSTFLRQALSNGYAAFDAEPPAIMLVVTPDKMIVTPQAEYSPTSDPTNLQAAKEIKS